MNDALIHLAESTKGFLSEKEGQALYEQTLSLGGLGPGLEIGSYCGKSTIYLGSACRQNGNVLFAVDHHQGSEEQQPGEAYFDPALLSVATLKTDTFGHFRETLAAAELEDTVVPLVCSSALAARQWQTPLAFIFIDGGHAAETVATDYRLWTPHLLPGGLLIFHDIYPDPADGGQAPYEVYRQAASTVFFEALPMVESLGILRCLTAVSHPAE